LTEAFAPWKKLEAREIAEYQEFQDKKISPRPFAAGWMWKELTPGAAGLVPFA